MTIFLNNKAFSLFETISTDRHSDKNYHGENINEILIAFEANYQIVF